MNITPLLSLSLCFTAFADTTHWEFSENTAGEDLHWFSPTSVDSNADQYEYVYEITYVAVDIIFLGQIIGPNDVTDQMDQELLFDAGIVNGPCPIVFMDESLEADADSDGDIDVAADFLMKLNGKGYGEFHATNVFLGDVSVDTGWPFGWQYVDIDRIYMDGYIDITPITNECPADTNGDGIVNVSDLLIAIGNWGSSGAGDIDGSGTVDVSDILTIVSAWGSC